MQQNLQDTIALLSRTPATLNALLGDLPASWTNRDEGPNTWTASDVVNHLIHCEQGNWLTRAKRILEAGESKTFDPLDREANLHERRATPLPQALAEFARLRSENLRELQALRLQPEDLDRSGRHPAFGPVTLSQLLATWASHDLTHLHQIARIMAHQYREAVGPWNKYLGVLQCAGHSSVS